MQDMEIRAGPANLRRTGLIALNMDWRTPYVVLTSGSMGKSYAKISKSWHIGKQTESWVAFEFLVALSSLHAMEKEVSPAAE